MGNRFAKVLGAVGLIGVCASCALLVGIDTPMERAAPDDDAGDASPDVPPGVDGAPSCGTDFVCAPAVPSGWNGPVALADVDGGPPTPVAPACAAPYPTIAFTGNAGVAVAPTECTCACGSAVGQCELSLVLSTDDTGKTCSPTCAQLTLSDGECYSIPGACGTGIGSAVFTATPDGGSCVPQATQTLPTASWTDTVIGCSGVSSAESCGSGTCAPLPAAGFLPKLCVYQLAAAACPQAGYTETRLYYQGVMDTRACAACTCGPATFSCSSTLIGYPGPACAGTGSLSLPAGSGCNATGTAQTLTAKSTLAEGGTCAPSQAPATGGMEPMQQVTVCCAP